MVFSNKPLQFILVALVASLPLLSSANNSVDSVKAETTAKVEVAAHHEEAKETKVLSKEEKAEADRKAFVKHHLLDSHDFTLFSYGKDEEHQKHFGFALPVILIDMDCKYSLLLNLNTGKQLLNLMVTTIK